MSKLHLVGKFRELWPRSPLDLPSILGYLSETAHPQEESICEYLCRGAMLTGGLSIRTDALDSSRSERIGSGSLLTDGIWAWNDDLPYYVRTYHVALPASFVAHMRKQNWHPKPVDDSELLRLDAALKNREFTIETD